MDQEIRIFPATITEIMNPTATRYLDELEKEGKIKQVGNTGKHRHYEKI